MAMIEDIETYFSKGCGRCARFATPECSTRKWAKGLAALRRICLETGAEETVRWGHPCYRHAGRNIAVMGAFRGDFRLSLFEAGLLEDSAGLLTPSGPNTPVPNTIRFTSSEEVTQHAADIRALLADAMGHAEARRRAPKTATPPDLSEELIDALDADPELAAAFATLTPGRQRSYAIAIAGAKQPKTRIARVEKYRDRILAGKGAMER